MFTNEGTVIDFNNPKVQAPPAANTLPSGHAASYGRAVHTAGLGGGDQPKLCPSNLWMEKHHLLQERGMKFPLFWRFDEVSKNEANLNGVNF